WRSLLSSCGSGAGRSCAAGSCMQASRSRGSSSARGFSRSRAASTARTLSGRSSGTTSWDASPASTPRPPSTTSSDIATHPARLDRLAVTGTRVLVAALAGVLLAALALLILSGAGPPLACLAAALGAGIPAIAALLLARAAQQRGALKRSLLWSYTAYAAAV